MMYSGFPYYQGNHFFKKWYYGATFNGAPQVIGANYIYDIPGLGKKFNIAMMNWGFVDGKPQTRLPWDSWKKPYTSDEPPIWFHEVFRKDGTPYRKAETDLIKRLTAAPRGVVPLN